MRVKPDDARPIHYYTRSRVAVFTNALSIMASMITTLVPAALLFWVKSQVASILIMLVSAVVFSIVFAACTSVKPHKMFLATATLCAILVAIIKD